MTVDPSVTLAADLIEPHIKGSHRRRDRALGNAQDLADAGLLCGVRPRSVSRMPVLERAVNVLRCRQPWSTAEKIAAELDAAGLLRRQG